MMQPESWAGGSASLLTFAAVAFFCALTCVGLYALASQRRMLTKAKRTEIALEALALAFETQFMCDTLRNTFAKDRAWGDAKAQSRDKHRRASHYSAILKRLDLHNSYFARLWQLQPRYMAEFGVDRAPFFRRPQSALTAILVYSDDAMSEATSNEPYQALDYWRSTDVGREPTSEELAKIISLLGEFVDRIQEDCIPLLTGKSQSQQSSHAIATKPLWNWREQELLLPIFHRLKLGNLALRKNRTFRRIRRLFINNYQLGLWFMFAVFAAGIFRLLAR